MTSIKMFCALPKRADISDQEFHDHWRHPHGTLAATITTARHYVQSHRVPDEIVDRLNRLRYEGVVEVWFDNPADALGMPEHPMYRKHLAPDEPNFIDVPGMDYVFTDENVIRTAPDLREGADEATLSWDERRRPIATKLIQIFPDRAPDLGSAQESALARRIGAVRHTVCIPNAAVHSTGRPSIAGVRELWWPTVTDFRRGIAGDQEAWNLLADSPAATGLYQAERLF